MHPKIHIKQISYRKIVADLVQSNKITITFLSASSHLLSKEKQKE